MTQATTEEYTRRHFLALGLGAVAAGAGASYPRAGREDQLRHDANDRIQVAVIGCGRRGSALLDVLRQQVAGAALIATCDLCPSRRAQVYTRHRVPAFADWREVVAREDVDAVVIAAPDPCRAEIAVAALDTGKHVYCEAPAARTAEEARALHDAWRRSSRAVQIGVAELSLPGWHEARAIVERGDLGPIRWCQTGGAGRAGGPVASWRRTLASSNGPALEHQLRQLTALLSVFNPGSPLRVAAAGGALDTNGGDAPDCLLTTIEYPGDLTVVLSANVPDGDAAATLRGSGQTLRVRQDKAVLFANGAMPPRDKRPADGPTPATALAAHVSDWLDAIRAGRPCRCGPDLALSAQPIIDAALSAYQQARTVNCA